MRVKIEEQKDGEFSVEFIGDNNEPWFRSTEGYTRRADAVRSLEDFLGEITLADMNATGDRFDITVEHYDAEGKAVNYREHDEDDG